MRKLVLSYNQSKAIVYNNEEVRVSRNGEVLYISMNDSEELIARTWLGTKQENINIVLNEYFQ